LTSVCQAKLAPSQLLSAHKIIARHHHHLANGYLFVRPSVCYTRDLCLNGSA